MFAIVFMPTPEIVGTFETFEEAQSHMLENLHVAGGWTATVVELQNQNEDA